MHSSSFSNFSSSCPSSVSSCLAGRWQPIETCKIQCSQKYDRPAIQALRLFVTKLLVRLATAAAAADPFLLITRFLLLVFVAVVVVRLLVLFVGGSC